MEIDPKFLLLYQWKFSDREEYSDVKFDFSHIEEETRLEIAIKDEGSSIRCMISNQPCILAGKLTGPISRYEKIANNISDGLYIVRLWKVERVRWNHIISDFIPENKDIDPKSAFELYLENENEEFLNSAIANCYPPAMNYYALNGIVLNQNREKCIQLFIKSADVYNNADAIQYLATDLLDIWTHQEAIARLEKASEFRDSKALSKLGNICSPFEKPHWIEQPENPDIAAEFYQKALNEDPNNTEALYGLARLYSKGAGVSYNPKAAKELLDKAISLNEDLERFETGAGSKLVKNAWIIGISAFAVSGLGYAFFKKFNRK